MAESLSMYFPDTVVVGGICAMLHEIGRRGAKRSQLHHVLLRLEHDLRCC